MITHTQTKVIPRTETTPAKGNCWQTCAAAILELPIAVLPDQVAVEDAGWSFSNALIAYLAKHHGKGLAYWRQWDLRAPVSVNRDVFHIICGPSPRTPDNGVNHCIVGYAGAPFWDVHPSRAGLTGVNEFQFIVDLPADAPKLNIAFGTTDCLCSACGGVIAKPEKDPPPIVVREYPCQSGGNAFIGAEEWVHEYVKFVDTQPAAP